MSREIRADYTQQFVFPPALEKWVKEDDPARFIRAFVESLDLREIAGEEWAKAAKDPEGRPHYAFDLLLRVWLYGYLYNIRSSRKLERACRQMIPLVWLAGMHEPDHNTLWRFWTRYRETLKKVFVHSVRVAMEANLVGMVLQAVDGTKIVSAGSRRTAWHRADLAKMLAAVDERIEKLEREIAEAHAANTEVDDRLPAMLQNETQLRARVKEALQTLDKADREHMHPHDPDARMMKGGTSKRIEFAYNAQAVCDASSGIVVAEAVVEDENDTHQLGPMLEQVQDNTGRTADETLADSGYDTAESLAKAEALEVWQSCPVGKLCSKKGPRVIEIGSHYGAVLRQRSKRADTDAKKRLRRRSEIIERLFGQIKGNDGFTRWTFRGKQKVAAQFTMICTAINLRKLIAELCLGRLASA